MHSDLGGHTLNNLHQQQLTMNFIMVISTMTAVWHRSSASSNERQGKFLGFSSSDDMLSDILDEVDDPFPVPKNTLSIRDYVLQKIKRKPTVRNPDPIPPIPIPQHIVQRLTTTPPPSTTLRPKGTTDSLILYDSANSKYEITPAGFASQPQPITEGMFLIGGQFGHGEKPAPNMTDQNLKIFWSSLGDFIESVPFLPIQVNVPDLLTAMANFFSERLPFVNRHPDGSQPRPNTKIPQVMSTADDTYLSDLPMETNLLEYRRMDHPSTPKPKRKKKKGNKKRKNVKTKNTTEGYKLRGLFSTTERSSKATAKAWFQKSTESSIAKESLSPQALKLFHHNNSPDAEQIRYKNMPIIRKVNRWRDKEVFNFRDSTMSNSPIMILNMPQRHVMFYKLHNAQMAESPYLATTKKYRY